MRAASSLAGYLLKSGQKRRRSEPDQCRRSCSNSKAGIPYLIAFRRMIPVLCFTNFFRLTGLSRIFSHWKIWNPLENTWFRGFPKHVIRQDGGYKSTQKNLLNQEIRNLAAGSFRIRPELNPCFQANIGKAHRGGCLAGLGDSHGWISKSKKPGLAPCG